MKSTTENQNEESDIELSVIDSEDDYHDRNINKLKIENDTETQNVISDMLNRFMQEIHKLDKSKAKTKLTKMIGELISGTKKHTAMMKH